MDKCCNYTDNSSPTLDQCRAIEINWNKFINDFFKEIDDKYPDTDLTKVDLNQGTTLMQNPNTRAVKKHATTNRPLYQVMTVDFDVIEIADEELSAIRLKGHLQDVEDNIIHHNMQIHLNSQRMVVGIATGNANLNDKKEDEGNPNATPPLEADPNKVTHKGLTSALAANKVILRKHEGHMQYGGYEREELIIDSECKTIT